MSDNKMTYMAIVERCKTSANEMLPDLPTKNTLEAWESYRDELESLRDEFSDVVWQEVDSWDWSIYTHYGLKILEALPYSDVCDAESLFFDTCSDLDSETLGGVYEFASKVAYFALCNMLQEYLETAIDECTELAESHIENLEGIE
jgi:hypothetical protein